MKLKFLIVGITAIIPFILLGQKWTPKKAPLMSKFAHDVNPDHVLDEYPRPQMERRDWMNLNGLWQYEPGTAGQVKPKAPLSGYILVPFPVESALSGVQEHHARIWYRRQFSIPKEWKGKRILLHFGAVDYESEVFINGKSQGIHEGGYDPFSFDITSFLKSNGLQEIMVRVYDPTDSGGYPRGKQTLNPRGIMYTSVTGIWQSVWIEPVAQNYISEIKIIPDVDQSVLKLQVFTVGDADAVNVSVKDGMVNIQNQSGKANQEIIIRVPKAKLWSPDNPFLYDMKITLMKGKIEQDKVASYFGMRKISVENNNGYKKLFLNNKFLFETGPLDQGFWPDGIYTAPTDQALRYDLEMIKSYGFNMVRKHIKVEPYRWYYWADKLGIMVWQDMPSANSYTEHTPPVDTAAYAEGLRMLVKTHWNSPSIIMWVLFNEEQAQHNTEGYAQMVHALDPSRLVNQASGGAHFNAGDILDIHSYPAPSVPYSLTQALACGEYGGIAFSIQDHVWNKGFGYVTTENVKDYLALYGEFANDLTVYKTSNGLSASVYTQITDVETELNGLMTYDRSVSKAPPEAIKKNNENIINGEIYLTEILPSSQKTPRVWNYTFESPDSNWFAVAFNESSWKSGRGGFGSGVDSGSIHTIWTTKDIWLRQEFKLGTLPENQIENAMLWIRHDDDCEIYLNGVRAAVIAGSNPGYVLVPISSDAKNAIRQDGENLIAIHCKQTGGDQFIDAGISVMRFEKHQ